MRDAPPVTAAYSFAALAVEQAYERHGQDMEAEVSLEVLRVIDVLCAAAEAADTRRTGEAGRRAA